MALLLARTEGWVAGLRLAALSLAGVPPLSGFWAKLLVIRSALAADHLWLAVLALAVGLLTLYSMTKIWQAAFWTPPAASPPTPPQQRAILWMGLPVALLATAACDTIPSPEPQVAASSRCASPGAQRSIDLLVMHAAIAATPFRVRRLQTNPTRRMLMSRSSFENPSPFERFVRMMSPSRISTFRPRSSRISCTLAPK